MTSPALRALALTALSLPAAGPALAQPLCSDRPGKATPTCVAEPGVLQIETSVTDWTHDESGGVRIDNFLFADTLIKLGMGTDTEVRADITPYVRNSTHSPAGETVADGFGDIALSMRHRLVDGGGDGLSLAVQPFVIVPTGSGGVSAGTWAGGASVPIDVPLPRGWDFNVTPTIAAAADSDSDGDHLAYSAVAALTHAIVHRVSGTVELWGQRDNDPLNHTTQATADFLLAWQPSANWQFDLSNYVGLTRASPDVELIAGFTHRF